jgi:predicted RNase H-like HicB family nuclease
MGGMLSKYIQAAMDRASYELLEDQGYYGRISGFEGVWSSAATLEACRRELEEVLEDWILLSVARHLPLPVIDGIEIKVQEVA